MLDFFTNMDLSQFSGIKKSLSKDKQIEISKRFNEIYKAAQNNSKGTHCYYCGNKCKGFCNSHTTPAFCLRHIAVNGKLYHLNTLVDLPILKNEKGINESGTFHIICRDCDSKLFQDYENENNYIFQPSTKMLAEIALKNSLKLISKRKFENSFYEEMLKIGLPKEIVERRHTVNNMDEKEFVKLFNHAKKSVEKPFDTDFHLYTHIVLPYRIPIAFQGFITLVCDLENVLINNIYSLDASYEEKSINLCLFPLETQSIILMFVESGNKRYRSFFKQFNKLSQKEQLEIINYIVFSYSEDFFLSPLLSDETITALTEAGKNTTDLFTTSPFLDPRKAICDIYNFESAKNLPNILSEQYKII